MTAAGFISLCAALLGFLSQLNWIAGNGPDSIWWLRLMLGAGGGWLLAWAGLRLWRRLAGREPWAGFPEFRRRLADPRALAWLTLAFFLLVFLLSMGGRFYSYDDKFRFQTTKAMVERGELMVSLPPGSPPVYSKYGIVQPVLSIPLYLLGKQFKGPGKRFRQFDQVMVSTLQQAVTAAALAVFFLLLLELGYSRAVSLGVAFLLAFTTMVWPYAKFFFTEPLNGLCLLLTCLLLIRFRRTGSRACLAGAGWALAAGLANASMLFITAAPLFSLYAAWLLWPRPNGLCADWGQALSRAAWFFAPLALSLAFVLGFNAYRFGSPFTTGYEGDRGFVTLVQDGRPGFSLPWWVGVYGLLFSAGKSVFLYNPILIPALVCLGPFMARRRAEGLLFSALCLAFLAFYAKWWAWHGDICWGPRYLVPVLPLAMAPLAEALAGWSRRGRGFKALFICTAAVGLAVQLLAISAPFAVYFQSVEGPRQSNWHLLHYVPQFSPLWGQLKVAAQGFNVDFFLQKTPVSLWLAWAAGLCGALLWLGACSGRGETQKYFVV